MSLFKAREWWSTWCGNAEEEFDQGNLCIANIDNANDGLDKVIVGSLNGVLRIFVPQKEGFKPNDLMLEIQTDKPILQVAAGKFVSGTDQLHLCVLHPRTMSVYNVTAITASVEHSNHFTLTKMYEHRLERTAASITLGEFGGVKDKDFICVLSMDGALTFFEQETFSLQIFLPNFLLPGPFTYVPGTDSFLFSTCGRSLESFKYNSLASAMISDKKGKKIVPDWTKSLGEHVIDMKYVNSSPPFIFLLGERSLFKFDTTGKLLMMKKLEYNPSSFYPYVLPGNANDSCMVMISSHNSSLQIYRGIELVWAAQLPHTPVSCKIGQFEDLSGILVTIDEFGHVYTSYLGTDPSLFTAPSADSRMGNFEELEKELKQLNALIKKCESGKGTQISVEENDKLVLRVHVPDQLDEVSQHPEQAETNDDEPQVIPTITVKIDLECKRIKPIENITLMCTANYPIVCNTPQIDVPIIGNKGPLLTFNVSFFTTAETTPTDLEASITASYTNESDAPLVLQQTFQLPLNLVSYGTPPVKQAIIKLTMDTNREPVNLAEIFPEMVNDAVIPVPLLGIQYFGGPVVTILTSKQSNRYRIQSDMFDAVYLVLCELMTRIEAYYDNKPGGPKFKATYHGQLPVNEYFELVDAHFELRVSLNKYEELLSQRASQFRVIQKRLLTRFKDKTPSPLAHLDTILDGTYKQILALADEHSITKNALKISSIALSAGTKLLTYLLRTFASLSDESYAVLLSCMTSVVSDTQLLGWEETVNNNIGFLLRTCLAKSVKEQNSSLPNPTIDKDTSKLKRNFALMLERLSKGATLRLNNASKDSSFSIKDQNTLEFGSSELGTRLLEASDTQAGDIRNALERVDTNNLDR